MTVVLGTASVPGAGAGEEDDQFGASLASADLDNGALLTRGTGTVPTKTGAIVLPELGGALPD